jgi:hypothetical protein
MAYPCARHSFSYRHHGIGGLADDEDDDNDSDEARSSDGGGSVPEDSTFT